MEDVIIDVVLYVTGANRHLVFSRSQHIENVIPRQMIHYFVRKNLKHSLKEIGSITGHGHCTVIHSVKSIKNIIYTSWQPYKNHIENIENILKVKLKKYPKQDVRYYVFHAHTKLYTNGQNR